MRDIQNLNRWLQLQMSIKPGRIDVQDIIKKENVEEHTVNICTVSGPQEQSPITHSRTLSNTIWNWEVRINGWCEAISENDPNDERPTSETEQEIWELQDDDNGHYTDPYIDINSDRTLIFDAEREDSDNDSTSTVNTISN